MAYTKVKSLSFKKNEVSLTVASSNVFPEIYERVVLKESEEESIKDIQGSIFYGLEGREYQILPSVKSIAHYAYILSNIFEEYVYDDLLKLDIENYMHFNYSLRTLRNWIDEHGVENYVELVDAIAKDNERFMKNKNGEYENIAWIFIGLIDALNYVGGNFELIKYLEKVMKLKRDLFIELAEDGLPQMMSEKKFFFQDEHGRYVTLNMNGRTRFDKKAISIREFLLLYNKFSLGRRNDFVLVDEDEKKIKMKDILDLVDVEHLIELNPDIFKVELPEMKKVSRDQLDDLRVLIRDAKFDEFRKMVGEITI